MMYYRASIHRNCLMLFNTMLFVDSGMSNEDIFHDIYYMKCTPTIAEVRLEFAKQHFLLSNPKGWLIYSNYDKYFKYVITYIISSSIKIFY